eukprot:159578-Chlamydomonas_euryale.AAC.1
MENGRGGAWSGAGEGLQMNRISQAPQVWECGRQETGHTLSTGTSWALQVWKCGVSNSKRTVAYTSTVIP